MDGFLLPRDSSSYRSSASASASAAFAPYVAPFSSSSYLYQSSFPPRDRWSLPSSDLQTFSSYPRAAVPPLDRRSLAASRSFPRESFPSRAYPPRRAPDFRSRQRGGDAGRSKKKPIAAQNLGPTKKIFKQKQGGKAIQKTVQQGNKEGGKKDGGKKTPNVEPEVEKPKSSTKNLAKETKELHDLWRSGKKRKAEEEVKEEVAPKNQEEKPKQQDEKKSRTQDPKKGKGKKNKKWGKKNKKWGKKARADGKAEETSPGGENFGMTEEEKQVILDLHKTVCKSVAEFLGCSPQGDESAKEAGPLSEADGEQKPDTQIAEEVKGTDTEVPPEAQADAGQKPETLSPEELERREGEALTFFSKLFEENEELRKLYVEKCNNGMFDCLVCSSIDGKLSKKFRNLVSLVMHASKVSKTTKLPEHRGYGRTVCSILGWDPLRLPKVPRGKGIGQKAGTPAEGDAAVKQEEVDVEVKNSEDAKDVKADVTQAADENIEEADEEEEQVEEPVEGST